MQKIKLTKLSLQKDIIGSLNDNIATSLNVKGPIGKNPIPTEDFPPLNPHPLPAKEMDKPTWPKDEMCTAPLGPGQMGSIHYCYGSKDWGWCGWYHETDCHRPYTTSLF